jgi:ABC-type Na+ transport system ATPase subunit NatA
MPALRLLDASYSRAGDTIVAPVTLRVEAGEHAEHRCERPAQAHALAMMAGALLRPTSGSVLIGEYDPRVQPVHCKRVTGFVPRDPLPLSHIDAERFIAYRAALWDIDLARARAHARLLLERLGTMHEAFAYPIVAALLPSPDLLVLDRPQPAALEAIERAAGGCTIFTVRSGAE